MLILKIFIAAVIVIGLAELAERTSTKMAGLLAGLPVGSALVLFFYGLDFGAEFVDKVSPYNLLGLSASLSFVLMYYIGSTMSKKYSLALGLSLGLFSYLLVAYLLSTLHVANALLPALILMSLILFTHLYFSKIKEVSATKKTKPSLLQILGRGSIAVFFVVVANFSPQFFSDEMAGILSSFPSTILPFLLILHLSQGKDMVHSVIKFLPLGYVGVMIYSSVVGSLYIDFGVYWGTLLSLVIATGYLVAILSLISYKTKRQKQAETCYSFLPKNL